MMRVERYAKKLEYLLKDKTVLEVACGTAEFTIKSSDYSNYSYCIDLDDRRINHCIYGKKNIKYKKMDAAHMDFVDNFFDVVVMYNALAHLKCAMKKVIGECQRVKKADGVIIIIASWGLDKIEIEDNLIPYLESNGMLFVREDECEAVFIYI